MKRLSVLLLTTLAASATYAQTFTEWHDAEVNQINRAPMHATYKIFDTADAASGEYCDKNNPYRTISSTASCGTWIVPDISFMDFSSMQYFW